MIAMKKYQIIIWLGIAVFGWNISFADSISKKQNHIYIATFNVYILGGVDEKYKDIDSWDADVDNSIPDRIANLADVLAVGGFDLVAIQEVRSGPKGFFAIKDLQRALKDIHGMRYRFILSDYIGRGLVPEAMAFLYRSHKVRYSRIDGKRSVNIEIPGRDLVKTNWIAKNFDFTLISAHLAWGNESHRDAGYKKIKDIFNNPSNYSDDPDVIVLGDFNRFGKGFESVKKLTFDSSKFLVPNVTFFDPEFNEKKQVSKSLIDGKGVPGNNPQLISTTVATNKFVYDMILLSEDVAEEFPPKKKEAKYSADFGIIHFDEADGFGFQTGADSLSHDPLKKAFSDHRPLWMCFKTNLDEYDKTWD